jgi:hypothetical protein
MSLPYTNHHHYATADERASEHIPYLGGPEDRIVAAFTDAYLGVSAQFRTPTFANLLERHHPSTIVSLVAGILYDAGAQFQRDSINTFEPIAKVAAANARLSLYNSTFTKARRPHRFNPRNYRPRIRVTPIANPHPHVFPSPQNHIVAAKNLTMNLVTHINFSQRKKINKIVVQSFNKGFDPMQTGARISNVVGLFPRWQTAVDNLYTSMLANDIPARVAERRATTRNCSTSAA